MPGYKSFSVLMLTWFPLQSSQWARKVGRKARFCLSLGICNLSGKVFYGTVVRMIRDTGYEMIWVQPCKLLGMAHLLVAVPVRISISYLQATLHLINRWIGGFCCGTVNVCSSRSVLYWSVQSLWEHYSRSVSPGSPGAHFYALLPLILCYYLLLF